MFQPTTISEPGRAYLRLHLANGVGPITLRRLLEHFGDAETVLGASADALRRIDGVGRTIAQAIRQAVRCDDADREVEQAAACGVHIVCPQDEEYPPLLKHTPDGPICLYVKGRLERQDGVSLAIVGTRHPSHYGQEQGRRFAGDLARMGMTIVSGLAYGVDACAHQGALSAGGRTVAVLGNGLGTIYPPLHEELAKEIAVSGAVVSELPMAMGPDRGHFPRRNRIIAGMSLGALIVEGAEDSGALITARLANDYNREVFALPGRSDAPTSRGPNTLIRHGAARLVMSVGDILEELGEVGDVLRGGPRSDTSSSTTTPGGFTPELSDIERHTLDALGLDPLPMEMIVDVTDLSASEVAAALTTLQLKRLVRQLPGNAFIKR